MTSVVIPNPSILKSSGGIKMWAWLCSKRELFRIWKQGRNEEDRKKYYGAKKNVIRVVYVTVDQQAPEAVVVDSCCDGCELFRIARQRAGENRDIDGLYALMMKVEW